MGVTYYYVCEKWDGLNLHCIVDLYDNWEDAVDAWNEKWDGEGDSDHLTVVEHWGSIWRCFDLDA